VLETGVRQGHGLVTLTLISRCGTLEDELLRTTEPEARARLEQLLVASGCRVGTTTTPTSSTTSTSITSTTTSTSTTTTPTAPSDPVCAALEERLEEATDDAVRQALEALLVHYGCRAGGG
jgi:hypothetical protein